MVNSFYVCNTESILPALLCESQNGSSNSVLAMLAGSTPSAWAASVTGLVQHNDVVSQTFFFQVCFCFFKGPFPTSPLLFGNGPDPCRQTSCTLNAGIRNDDHRTGRLYFIQICKHFHLQLVVV